MARELIIEVDRGTYRGTIVHPHNGYYAGDFWSDRRRTSAPTRPVPGHQATTLSG